MDATNAALAAAPEAGTFLCTIGDHDVDRLASVIGDSLAKGRAAAAVLLTQPYAPIVYHGDEIGMRGVKATNSRRRALHRRVRAGARVRAPTLRSPSFSTPG